MTTKKKTSTRPRLFPERKPLALAAFCLTLGLAACKLPSVVSKQENRATPSAYPAAPQDSSNTARLAWRDYFTDPYLVALIDTALQHNQELNITTQELQIARNEIRVRRGEYLPFVGVRANAAVDKVARYTNIGALEATTDIRPGQAMPEPLPDFGIQAFASWEVDIWHRLRNAKKAAVARYLASVEGRSFAVTNLIAEVAGSYYELLALDNQLAIVQQNITIQNNALSIVRLQKESARVTELAVRKFEAEVYKTQSLQFDLRQQIVETENRINFLLGRFPQPIARNAQGFETLVPAVVRPGMPAQLLANRPDIRRAEQELVASKLDVLVAKAQFYPKLGISAAVGYQAFNPAFLLTTPESILYNLAGDLVAPLVNRAAIKSSYASASARQVQAAYNYERAILNGYVEVANQLSKISNLQQRYDLKAQQVAALTRSVSIAGDLFKAARADYMEVLLTQRDALEARVELIETKRDQLRAVVNVYQALGGGWQ